MIGWLQGTLQHVEPDRVLLTTSGGVGYEVHVPLSTYY
ncbi:MAG: OB-fold domain-containing protein, partial [Acidobacteriota bacterium]